MMRQQEQVQWRAKPHLSGELDKRGGLVAPDLDGLVGQLGLPVGGALAAAREQADADADRAEGPQPELQGHLRNTRHGLITELKPAEAKPDPSAAEGLLGGHQDAVKQGAGGSTPHRTSG